MCLLRQDPNFSCPYQGPNCRPLLSIHLGRLWPNTEILHVLRKKIITTQWTRTMNTAFLLWIPTQQNQGEVLVTPNQVSGITFVAVKEGIDIKVLQCQILATQIFHYFLELLWFHSFSILHFKLLGELENEIAEFGGRNHGLLLFCHRACGCSRCRNEHAHGIWKRCSLFVLLSFAKICLTLVLGFDWPKQKQQWQGQVWGNLQHTTSHAPQRLAPCKYNW